MVTTMVPRAPPLVVVEAGSVVKTTLEAAAEELVIDAEVTGVSAPSVAVMVQLVPLVSVTAEKVATPLIAATVVVPVRPQVEVITTLSVLPVTMLPLASSTSTVKVDSGVPAVEVVGGNVPKTVLVAVPAVKVVDGELVVVKLPSVAVRVKGELLVRPVKVTPVKVATPLVALLEIVPPRVAAPETLRATVAEEEVTVLP